MPETKTILYKDLKKRRPKKRRTISYKLAKKKAWDAVSVWVRSSAADKNGIAECVTCGVRKPWRQLQAGHFVPGRGMAILFDTRGIHPQCFACNVFKKGHPRSYDRYMRITYGNQVVDELDELSTTVRKYTVPELLAIKDHYETLTKNL